MVSMTSALKSLSPEPLAPDIWAAIEQAYVTPPRAYHTLEHVLDVAQHWGRLRWNQPRDTFLAVLFHDAIYQVGHHDNEERSALLCEKLCGRHPRARDLILLTARHGHLEPKDVDDEAARFLDCDMAILGSDSEKFARYQQQIAQEYVPVIGKDAYELGRRKFLEALLARDRIFLSDVFHRRFDDAARRNLAGALK